MISYFLIRFPLLFILLSNGLSILVVQNVFHQQYDWRVFTVLTIMTTFYMFFIRVIDDYKDFNHDMTHYSHRLMQRSHKLLKMFLLVAILWVVLSISLLLFLQKHNAAIVFSWWIVFSLVSVKNFFLGKDFKQKFVLYNLINSLTIVFLVLFVYARYVQLSTVTFKQFLPLIIIVIGSFFLEIIRKIRSKTDALTNDTYEQKIWVIPSIALLVIISLILCFSVLFVYDFVFTPRLIVYCIVEFVLLLLCVLHVFFHTKFTKYACLTLWMFYYFFRLVLLIMIA